MTCRCVFVSCQEQILCNDHFDCPTDLKESYDPELTRETSDAQEECVSPLNISKLTKLQPQVILTESFEELSRGKFSIEEDGAAAAVEGAAHANEQDLQAA